MYTYEHKKTTRGPVGPGGSKGPWKPRGPWRSSKQSKTARLTRLPKQSSVPKRSLTPKRPQPPKLPKVLRLTSIPNQYRLLEWILLESFWSLTAISCFFKARSATIIFVLKPKKASIQVLRTRKLIFINRLALHQ